MRKFTSIDEYISVFPESTQKILFQLRKKILKLIPGASETISYGIPTIKQNVNLIHFAAYENHIGFYPGAATIEKFEKKFSGYKHAKGSVQFPLDKPLPFELIEEMVRFRIRINNAKKSGKVKK